MKRWALAWVEDKTVMTKLTQENSTEGETMLPITIRIGSREFEAELYDNETAKELVYRLPMTISMEELNGNEKYYYLPESLPADTREIGSIHEGDLMLFGSDCLVLFYKDFQTTYRYTRLGIVKDPTGLSDALGQGSVTVTFRLEGQRECLSQRAVWQGSDFAEGKSGLPCHHNRDNLF